MRNEAGFVDGHFHVIAPQAHHPMLAGRSYTPAPASLREWQHTLLPCGVSHGVVVQPSFYGTDNRVLVEAIEAGRGRLVGVAAVAADVSDATLDSLAAAGVRGVRMAHFEPGDARARGGFVPFSNFNALDARLHARQMHLQLFTDSRLLPGIADRLTASRVPVVIDHMGRTPAALGAGHVGIQTLARLMAEGPVWVKLSGIANISDVGPGYEDARAVHDALLAARPDRLLWGSDWPHTRPSATRPDTAALVRLLRAWTPPAQLMRIGRANAWSFYRFSSG